MPSATRTTAPHAASATKMFRRAATHRVNTTPTIITASKNGTTVAYVSDGR